VKRIALVAAVVLVVAGVGGVFAMGPLQTNPLVVALFGPPKPTLVEAYPKEGTAVVDHALLDGLLRRHVQGYAVDYAGLAAEEATLDAYLQLLADAPFDALSRDGKLALLINAYNAFTLKLILDHRPLKSIKDIPAAERWDAERWTLGGRTVSLTAIEHEELRARFVEPRIHFAINCASVGCPPLRAEAYVPERIDDQLETQTRVIHHDPRWLELDGRTVRLTPLYLWYQSDFEQVAGSPLAFAARYRSELADGSWSIAWTDYDWSLNDVE
jgi:hypothetical protein